MPSETGFAVALATRALLQRLGPRAATMDPKLKVLNAEKGGLVYRLLMLECQGHAVPGLNAMLQQA